MNAYRKLVRAAKQGGKPIKLTARDVQTLGSDPDVARKALEAGRLICERVGYHKRNGLPSCPCGLAEPVGFKVDEEAGSRPAPSKGLTPATPSVP
jgi:hypothetical protein